MWRGGGLDGERAEPAALGVEAHGDDLAGLEDDAEPQPSTRRGRQGSSLARWCFDEALRIQSNPVGYRRTALYK